MDEGGRSRPPLFFWPMRVRLDHPKRPWPAPKRPWAMRMNWHELLFMHWPVPVKALRPHVPRALDVETYDGTAWFGVVPFRMTVVRPRFVPPVRRFVDSRLPARAPRRELSVPPVLLEMVVQLVR